MYISAIVCTYNREKYLYNVLASIAGNDLDVSKYEIVLVNNNSTDATEAGFQRFKADYPNVSTVYCVETNQGLSYARNRGIAEAHGDVVVYVDDDALVNDKYLSTYFDFFENHTEYDAAGGPIIPRYETSEPDWMSHYTRLLLTGYLYKGEKESEFLGGSYPGGGNAAYRKSVFDKVGLFNVDLGRKGVGLMGSEEKDIFDKMRGRGMRIGYLPTAILYHLIPDFKLQPDYLVRLSHAIGQGERARTLAVSKTKYRKRVFMEGVKWCGTIAYWFVYFLQGKKQKGGKLIAFRHNVSRGLLGR